MQQYLGLGTQSGSVIAFNLLPMRVSPEPQNITWNDRSLPHFGGICELTNYSKSVLFDVDLIVGTRFQRAAPAIPDGFGPGQLIGDHDWIIRVPRIEAEKDRPFRFLIVNDSQAYVAATIKDAASALPEGENERKRVYLVRSSGLPEEMSLTPKDSSKLPQ